MDRAELNDITREKLIQQYIDCIAFPTQRANRPVIRELLEKGEFFAPREEDIKCVKNEETPPEGWYMTHRKKGYDIYINPVRADGSIAILLGATANRAFKSVPTEWVGQCEYLSYWKQTK